MQYSELRDASEKIYKLIKTQTAVTDVISEYNISSAFLLKDGEVVTLTNSKMGMMPMIRNTNLEELSQKGKYLNPMNEEFLYYKNSTDIGDIILLQNNRFSSAFMNATYIILAIIFFSALLISIPIVAVLGKRLTKPIIELNKASLNITRGNFNMDVEVNTQDEIEELSKSLKYMAAAIEQKSAMQRDFIANVSHDFKTPLSVIRNYSEAILDDILEEKDKKEYLKEIIKEVDRLNHLVMDILQLSKLQGRDDLIKKQYFNLIDFLKDFKASFKIHLQQKNIEFDLVMPDKNIEILADSSYIYRVVYNFIDNGIKFSKENGRIQLMAREEEKGIKVAVIDNGIGIDKEYLQDIWFRYYKNKKSGGMGLGLAICSEILKLHGFEYGVDSIIGEKTEFYFYIPKDSYRIK
jgi:signal transduction histidine kinase